MVDPPRTRARTRTVALALLLGCLAGAPLAAGAAAPDLRVSGQGVLSDAGPNPTVATWRPTTVTATVAAEGTETVCLRAVTPEQSAALGCNPVTDDTAAVTVDTWPTNLSGRVTLVATTRPNTTGSSRLERVVSLLRADSDADDDGPTNRVEIESGTDPTVRDTDGDGLADGAEVTTYSTDPTVRDSDGDGVPDGPEVTIYGTDPTQPNAAASSGDAGVDLSLVGPVPVVPASLLAVLLAGLLLGAVGVVFAASLWSRRGGDDTPTDGGDAEVPPADAPTHPDAREVRALLDDNDGRLRQSEIVERTDWSKSKVSRVVSSIADADQVRKIRVGRENLVVLPGAEPEHATGPFED